MKKFGFIIQARLGSTRLPGKMKMSFYNEKSIPEIIINKIRNKFTNIDIVLATSDNPKDEYFETLAKKLKVKIFRGSENDVLQRFIDTADFFQIEGIVRVCADNPFLDLNQLEVLIKEIDESEYISFCVNGQPSIKTHFGFWAEYTTLATLKKVQNNTDDIFFREHVTNYIYSNSEKFRLKFLKPIDIVNGRKDIRTTIDTEDDFKNLAFIYKQLVERYTDNFGIKEIIDFLDENPKMLNLMSKQIEQNSK